MRRPYNAPCVSIPENVSRPPFRPFSVVRPFGTLRQAQGPRSRHRMFRNRGRKLSIPARLLTKGDRPVAPTRTCDWVPASRRVGEDRLLCGGRAKDFSPLQPPVRLSTQERQPFSSPRASIQALRHGLPPPRQAQDTVSSRPRRLGDRRPPPSRKSQRWPGFKLRQAPVSGRTAVVPIWCRGTAAMLVPTWPRLAGGSSGHLLGPGLRRTA